MRACRPWAESSPRSALIERLWGLFVVEFDCSMSQRHRSLLSRNGSTAAQHTAPSRLELPPGYAETSSVNASAPWHSNSVFSLVVGLWLTENNWTRFGYAVRRHILMTGHYLPDTSPALFVWICFNTTDSGLSSASLSAWTRNQKRLVAWWEFRKWRKRQFWLGTTMHNKTVAVNLCEYSRLRRPSWSGANTIHQLSLCKKNMFWSSSYL